MSWDRAATVFAIVIAAAVAGVGFRFGAPVAGGSDSYGYVSQAHLWATGRMRDELPLVDELVPAVQAEVLVPLGYNLARDRRTMVPVYAAGMPLVMAVFERLAGARAVFWVVPLLGGVVVWSTFLLGRRAAGPVAGAMAAALLASSPALLFQLTAAPMSDLPAAAWWTLALALLWPMGVRGWPISGWGREGWPIPGWGGGGGGGFVERAWSLPVAALAAGIAILTRPNLAPVALVPLVLLLCRATAERRGAGEYSARPRRRDLIVFAAGVVAASAAVAAINTWHYGSPLSSGYDVRGLFGLEHLGPNLVRYPALLTAMHTPVVWLAAAAPWLAWRRRDERVVALVAASFVLAVFACYLIYPGFDAHQTLRFLLPGLPALLVLLGAALALGTARLPAAWRAIALVTIVGWMAARGVDFADERWAFDMEHERRYEVVGAAIAQRLPADAVILAMQHSGSVRHYAGREIVRYDLVAPQRLGRLMRRLRRLGRPAYLVLDEWEVPEFKRRFEPRSLLGTLDWPPIVEFDHVHVRVWDLSDRARRGPRRARSTEVVPWPFPQ